MTESEKSQIVQYEAVDGVIHQITHDAQSRGYSEATLTAGQSPVSPKIKITKSKVTVRWEVNGPGVVRETVLKGADGNEYRFNSEGQHEIAAGTYQHFVNGSAYSYPIGGPPFTNWISGKITSSVSW